MLVVAGADVVVCMVVEVDDVDDVDAVDAVDEVGPAVVVLFGGCVVVVVDAGPKSPIATATPPRKLLS